MTVRQGRAITILLETSDYREAVSGIVAEDGRVDLQEGLRRRELLNQFLAKISRIPEEVIAQRPPEDRKAFWHAVYHGLLLSAMLDRYEAEAPDADSLWPWETDRSVTTDRGFWTRIAVKAAGKRHTLKSIEDILWSSYPDPRWPFVLCRGTISGPSLPLELPTGNGLERFMESRARKFFADERNILRAEREKVVYFSPLVLWYRDRIMLALSPEAPMADEVGSDGISKSAVRDQARLIAALAPYFSRLDQRALEEGDYRIAYSYFDWKLPDTRIEMDRTAVSRPYVPGLQPVFPEKTGTGISDIPSGGRGSGRP